MGAAFMTPRPERNGLAILLMIASMFGFALADTLIKWSSETGSGGAGPGQIILYLGLSGLVLFGGMMLYSGQHLTRATVLDRVVVLRTVGDLIGVVGFTSALTKMPVGDASAILQIQPIIVMLGAAVFLREKVTLRRWVAVGIAFVGVMIIVRPGLASFHPASPLVLMAVIGLSIRDVATRVLDPSHSSAAVSLIACILLLPLGWLIQNMLDVPFDFGLETNIVLIASSVCGAVAYYAITQAMRLGEVSAVAPFRYSRLVAAFLVAYLLLGEKPDQWTILGSLIVVATGIWMLTGERKTP